jgi:hypothetical protein
MNTVIPVHLGVSYDAASQELSVESDGRHYLFQCVKLRLIEPLRISFSALTLPGSGSGQAPEEVILDFYF